MDGGEARNEDGLLEGGMNITDPLPPEPGMDDETEEPYEGSEE